MLSESEMREYARLAERDEWDAGRWGDVRDGPASEEPVIVQVAMSPQEVVALDARARRAGKTRSQYLRELAIA